jgi:hypothetical protein
MLITTDSSGKLVSSSTPTVASINATSTTATSTFAGGLSVAGTSGLTVLQNGRVGIGTASPSSRLSVVAPAEASVGESILHLGVSDSSTYFQLNNGSAVNGSFLPSFKGYNDSDGRSSIYFSGYVLDTAYNSDLYPALTFNGRKTNNTELTTTPVVSFANLAEAVLTSWYDARTKIGGTDTLSAAGEGATRPTTMLDVIGGGSDDLLQLFSSTASRLIVKESGNVGIGTTSPYAKLSVAGESVLGNSALAGYFIATSTSIASTFLYASTTALTVSGALYNSSLADGCLNVTGGLISSTGSACGAGGGGSDYPFPLTGNATSTLTQFNGGLTSYASTTIGNGMEAGGLTINGGATTTGSAYIVGSLGVGTTTSPSSRLTIDGSYHTAEQILATSTTMNIDFASATSSNMLNLRVGDANIAVSFTNNTLVFGKKITVNVCNPASGLIGSTTFSGVLWYGDVDPGSSVVNGQCELKTFVSSQGTSTPIIMGYY